jgi:heme exporter protein C
MLTFEFFYKKFNRFTKFLLFISLLFIFISLFFCFLFTPSDYQQKAMFKIIYIHVPSAFLSIFIYFSMGFFSFLYVYFDVKLADIIAMESVRIGSMFTILALLTGSIWAKPMWGTWWVWDARLTSELVLFFLYLGYSGLRFAIKNTKVASKCCAILSLVGLVNLPIIHYSVKWWYTLHQGYTLRGFLDNTISGNMFYPLVCMIGISLLFYVASVSFSVCSRILEVEKDKEWVYKEVFILPKKLVNKKL